VAEITVENDFLERFGNLVKSVRLYDSGMSQPRGSFALRHCVQRLTCSTAEKIKRRRLFRRFKPGVLPHGNTKA
jgi:hypothetical protein